MERGSQFAHGLRDSGVPPGGRVVIILPHSTDLYCGFFGAILGGYVPAVLAVPSFKLNTDHYRKELDALFRRIGAGALITDKPTAEQLGITERALGDAVLTLADAMPPERVDVPDARVSADDVVLLQHSSGSTGLKKGVALSNRSVLHQIDAYASTLGLRQDDRIASWLPLYHDMGLIACAVLPEVMGLSVTAISPFHWVTRPVSLFEAIAEDRCSLAWMPNFAYDFLAQRVRPSQLQGIRLDSMRAWINCSEPTLAQSHRRFLASFEAEGVKPRTLWTCYAAAETTFAVTQSSDVFPPMIEKVDRERFLSHGEAVPVGDSGAPSLELMSGGGALLGTEVKVVDPQGADLPERRIGEIAIRSDSLFSGYFRDPESTSSVLRDGWYFSGDLGYRAEGHLFVTGRKKDLIIIGGANYYPQDIERIVSSVSGIHPGRVVALGLEDPAIGTQRLIVLAEVDDPALVDSLPLASAVRTAVSQELDCVIDDLRLLPHMWLTKTSSGKIARAPNLRRYMAVLPQALGRRPGTAP